MPGFIPKPRTKTVVCELLEYEDGSEPLWATIACNLSFVEIDTIREMLRDRETKFVDVWEMCASKVLAWNATAFDKASGEWAPVEPPAEAGADAFRAVDPLITSWIMVELSRSHLGGAEREEKSKPSDDTPAADGDENSTSPAPTGKKSRNRSPKG